MKGMNNATMLYRRGTKTLLHDVKVDTIIVEEQQVDQMLLEGWHRTPTDVKEWEHGGTKRIAANEAEIARAREAGIRAAREEQIERERQDALRAAFEAGAQAERERLAAEAATKGGGKKGAEKQQAAQ
jgi:hypothetical protein